MKTLSVAAAITAVMMIALTGPSYAEQSCTVADPTGTPLNVRTLPDANSVIVGSINNGVDVRPLDRKGKWAFVEMHGTMLDDNAALVSIISEGWVYAPYLNCGWQVR